MTSYMMYMESKCAFIIVMTNLSLSLTKHVQKCSRNCKVNTKSSNFVKKWTKFQTKAHKCSKVHFIWEMWCSNRGTGRFDEKLGDSQENRESWQVWRRISRMKMNTLYSGEATPALAWLASYATSRNFNILFNRASGRVREKMENSAENFAK